MAKRIVMLGNSLAGVKALENIRLQDKEAELSIIGFDGYYPYRRDFAQLLDKSISANQIFYKSKDFYEKNKIQVLNDKILTRINLKRQKIYTEDKEQIDFDILLISETPEDQRPDIKGANKSGVYGFKKLKDIDLIIKSDPFFETIIMEADSPEAFELASVFLKKNKEVYFITRRPYLLSDLLSEDASKMLVEAFAQQKLKVITDNLIVEILGDNDAKAVRLKTGKVIAGSAIILEKNLDDLRIFSDTDFAPNQIITVNSDYQTSLENVYAVDKIINHHNWPTIEQLEYQGKKIAEKILGQEGSLTEPLYQRTFLLGEQKLSVVGNSSSEPTETQQNLGPEPLTFKKIFIKDTTIQKAVLLNREDQLQQLTEMIQQKTPLLPTEAASPN
jgi:nitrite reductase (NADH) large subunit